MKILFVEIYSKANSKIGFVAETFEKMRDWLEPRLDKNRVDSILLSLEEQSKYPEKFPNVVIFLDENNESMTIDDYVKGK